MSALARPFHRTVIDGFVADYYADEDGVVRVGLYDRTRKERSLWADAYLEALPSGRMRAYPALGCQISPRAALVVAKLLH